MGIFLWIPILVVLAICMPIFCVQGYKKGLWRALISLGTSIVCVGVSFLVAKLCAAGIVSVVMNMIPEISFGSGMTETVISSLVGSAITGVVAIFFFGSILFITMIIFKLIAANVKKDKLITENKPMKFAGLAVRAVDAIVMSLFLLLPFYGTIAAYAPAAETVVSMIQPTENEDADQGDFGIFGMDIKDVIGSVTNHPVVKITNTAPFMSVYNGLATAKTETGGSINIAEMAATMNKAVDGLKTLAEKDPSEFTAEDLEMIEDISRDVIGSDWFYAAVTEMKDEIKDAAINKSKPEVREFYENLTVWVEAPKEEFEKISDAVAELFSYAVKEGAATAQSAGSLEDWVEDSGILEEAERLQGQLSGSFKLKDFTEQLLSMLASDEDQSAE